MCRGCRNTRQREYRLGIRHPTLVSTKPKTCAICKGPGPFRKDSRRKSGEGSYCNSCCSQLTMKYLAKRGWTETPQHALYRKTAKARCAGALYAWRRCLQQYGITEDQWWLLFEQQGRCCAICATTVACLAKEKRWATDHDHVTGAVRGILCHGCNLLLGKLGDSLEPVCARLDKCV